MPSERVSFVRRVISYRWLFLINLVVLAFLVMSFGREYLRNAQVQAEIARMQADEQELKDRGLQILELNRYFDTEAFLEHEGRLKLGLQKPGEHVVVISEAQTTSVGSSMTAAKTATATDAEVVVTNPQRWWAYFFDQTRYQSLP